MSFLLRTLSTRPTRWTTSPSRYALENHPLLPQLTSPQWIEEVRSICGAEIPVLLVGCKSDLRPPEGSPNSQNFVSRAQAEQVAQAIGARAYKECSALKIEGVDDVFEAATRASMLMREGVPTAAHHRRKSSGRTGEEWEQTKGGCCVIC